MNSFTVESSQKWILFGGVHNTVASLHLESWRNEVMDEINRIKPILQLTDTTYPCQKTTEIQEWMASVVRKFDYYKSEHLILLKEATTLLELALWQANLDDKERDLREGVRTTRGSRKIAKKINSVTSGASIVIKNVLPFLVLKT